MTSLITTSEIISTFAGRLPASMLCDVVGGIEQQLRRECFGAELWDYMAALLRPAVEWQCETVYNSGDVVIYNGRYYESKTGGNNYEPCELSFWHEVSKFTTDCAEMVWNKYMRQIIEGHVHNAVLPKTAFRETQAGPIMQAQDANGQRPPTMAEIGQMQANVMRAVNTSVANMREWLEDQPTGCNIPNFPDSCSGQSCAQTNTGIGHVIMM